MNSIKEKFENDLKISMIKLLNKDIFKFIGILASGFEHVVLNDSEYKKIMGEDSKSLAFTDGKKIYYLAYPTCHGDIIFSIIHETLHIISNHIGRSKNKNKEIYQLATDHVVNSVIYNLYNIHEEKSDIKWDTHCVFFKDIYDEYPNASVETVYDLLLNKNKSDKMKIEKEDTGNSSILNVSYGKQKMTCSCDVMDASNISIDDKNISSMITWAKCLSKDKELMCEGKGYESFNLAEYISNFTKVKIDWEYILSSSLLYCIQNESSRCWNKLNDIYRPLHMYLPGRKNILSEKILVVCIDTSGSISTDDLKRFLYIIKESISKYESVIIIQHDTEIKSIKTISNSLPEDEINHILASVVGRGGTSHSHVFNILEQYYLEDMHISNVLFLTDFISNVESIYKNYEWLKFIPNIWVLNNNKNVSLEDSESIIINI